MVYFVDRAHAHLYSMSIAFLLRSRLRYLTHVRRATTALLMAAFAETCPAPMECIVPIDPSALMVYPVRDRHIEALSVRSAVLVVGGCG